MTEGRLTQLGIKTLTRAAPEAELTLLAIKTLGSVAVPAHLTQLCIKTLVRRPRFDACAMRLATCWKITRTDAVVKRFTTLDVDLIIDGQTFKSCDAIDTSAVELSATLAAGDMDVLGIVSSEITTDDLRSGVYDGATFEVFAINVEDLTKRVPLHCGLVGDITFGASAYEAVMLSWSQLLEAQIGDAYVADCRWNFGSTECGVALGPHTFAGTVTTQVSRSRVYASAFAALTGAFAYGKLTATAGPNIGLTRQIKSFNLGEVSLWEPFPYDFVVGNGLSIIRGCRRSREACIEYANINRFGGFRTIPGSDSLFKYPDAKAG